MPTDKYWLFAGDQYYPSGGMEDFIDSDNDCEKLKTTGSFYHWAHILDVSARKIIYTQVDYSSGERPVEWESVSDSLVEFRADCPRKARI